jgi:hypothetical protein
MPGVGTMSSLEPAEGEWRPGSEAEKQQVRDQLQKILASSHFLISRRYPNLLRFVVEQTLEGQEDALKERLLGIEVFHRSPDYDTNQDPVVRLSAAEVRKRIALYYQHPGHQNELVIGLNPGSYIPYFRPAQSSPASRGPDPAEKAVEAISIPADVPRRRWPLVAACLAAGAVAAGLGLYFFLRPSVIDQFWSPVLGSPASVSMCVGSPDAVNPAPQTRPNPATLVEDLQHSGRLGTANVATLMHMGGVLEDRHKAFRLVLASQASFPQLREGPVVLVGALDNTWTMRLTKSLRYGFTMDSDSMYIVDHKNPSARSWVVLLKQPPSSQTEDYAVIARYHDTTLDQPVVLAAGLSRQGTEAAGELLSNAAFLKTLFQNAPSDWTKVNLEAVVQTQVIDGHPGPSRILAVEYW